MSRFALPTGLFGGSFDPVHEGHLHVARSVLSLLPEIKQIMFIPAAVSPGKPGPVAPGAQRLEWLRLAVEPSGFQVWDLELQRAPPSYTVDTLAAAVQEGAAPERLFWILGADAYAAFPGWREPARIRELCRLVVVGRPGQELRAQHQRDLLLAIPPHSASSSEIRSQLASGGLLSTQIPLPVREAMDKLLPGQNPYVRK